MTRIKSLYDALIKTQVEENQCTNFLIWLLEKLPNKILIKVCEESKLSLSKYINDDLDFKVQYPLIHSQPDAVIESQGKFLVIETKIYPNAFDKNQFISHFVGACKEFVEENVWLLFLSGDKKIPRQLDELIQCHAGRMGFLSWERLLLILKENKESVGERYEIIIEEFLIFAKSYRLGRLISMNNEEMAQFIQRYSELEKFRDPCTKRLLQVLDNYKDKIILECEEKVEKSDDKQKELPCLYRGLNMKGWHTDRSAYIYINILQKTIGICFVGYQSKNEKEKFLNLWEEKLKEKYAKDLSLISFTWVDKGDDELAINQGYFKIIEGTTGKLFNPTKIKEFSDCFYIGKVYPLDISKLDSMATIVASNFRELVDKFMESH